MKIKICGLSTKEAVDTAVESGATHLGFILSPSKRQVAPEKILQITNDVPKTVKKVGVFVDEPINFVKKAIQVAQLDLVQLHGNEDMNYINQLDVSVIKAIRPDQEFKEYEDVILLFDSPQAGSGQAFDWDSLVTSGLKNKFLIAGGLNPENVAAAIQHFPNAYGVDVSSGVETDGIKNLTKIKNFVQNASLASSKQLFIEFLRITKKLNENKIIPYLMGSLAVEQIINFPTNPDDIDIQLKKLDFENFEQLTSLMEELGYQPIDLHEHKFEKASIHVGFASVETLKNYAGVDDNDIPKINFKSELHQEFFLPTLKQNIQIYQAAVTDSWRAKKTKDKKILKKLLFEENDANIK
ncbi:phosphoribosylanthranilate isomerase [Lactococcus sp. S47]|uniref:phosphoribosylanthranilate isomerase n=1 Tax=Lactococcus sp. S47 TaxID=2767460 RepID=UPI001904A6C9|nr:phosphoribosylanthranilate isomerase [Lactococcus sp. S47]MBK0029398.1 phosphoribosylanthranilate isomerase [Lactococcus sp. S47]